MDEMALAFDTNTPAPVVRVLETYDQRMTPTER